MFTQVHPSARGLALVSALIVAAIAVLTVRAGGFTASADQPGASLATCGDTPVQFLGFSDALNKTTFGAFSVAELSGITYDRDRGVYYAVADRAGAVDGLPLAVGVEGGLASLAVAVAGAAGAAEGELDFILAGR